ncbi:hypothetical protein [Microcoleus sp. herbarium14]|uniref:hypothetical protein n=1 Tax=Microcoleus sp. herbarium14 TaxID=3055439 RepID=UPI002FD49140
MAATKEGRDFISSILKLADTGTETAVRTGMKTTSVAGYPVFIAWGRWGGSELNASGNNKAFLFLPYLQSGQMPLQKFNGATSIETPLDMVMSEVPNPYNCKLGVTPSLNISKLVEGEYYNFVLALKPAAVGNGNNPTPYWDGWLKAVGNSPSDVFKEYLALFNLTKTHWTKVKVSQQEFEDEDDESSNAAVDVPNHS